MRARYLVLALAALVVGCLVPKYGLDSGGSAGSSGAPDGAAGSAAGRNSAAGTGAGGASAGGSASAGAGTGGLACTSTQKSCAGECVDVDNVAYGCSPTGCDAASCPAASGATLVCDAGKCVIDECGAGTKKCGDRCVTIADPTFGCTDTGCSAQACPDPGDGMLVCNAGQCEVGTCGPDTKPCDSKCVPLDRNNGCRDPNSCDPCSAIEECGTGAVLGCKCAPDSPCDTRQCGTPMNRCGTTVYCTNECTNDKPLCSDDGLCYECLTVDDCPQTSNACAVATCRNNLCGFDFAGPAAPCPGGTCSASVLGLCLRPAVNMDGISMDATEVTRFQYQLFLNHLGGTIPTQPPVCNWNTDFVPGIDFAPTLDEYDLPVEHVDWCDAYAYCEWQGRRLCGKIGGGSNNWLDWDKPALSQWMHMCSGPSNYTYPYGNTFDIDKCVGQPPIMYVAQPAPVATNPGCVGAYPKLYDLSGNLGEWEDSCNPVGATPQENPCHVRGGAYYGYDISYLPVALACAAQPLQSRDTSGPGLGFRCCGP